MRDLLSGLLELLLPTCCAACGGPAGDEGAPAFGALCRACTARLPRIAAAACTLCQRHPTRGATRRCDGCAPRRRPLVACLAGCWFEGEVADWVRAFKYPDPARSDLATPSRARWRALALLALARAPAARPDWLVPVPLHPRRLRARGFNPAAVAAGDAARALRLPLRSTALRRLRDTPSQTGLSRRERLRNVRGVFRARTAVPERIWLVDDVVTTGATLEEAARALRRAGAREVVALCLARTPAAPRGAR